MRRFSATHLGLALCASIVMACGPEIASTAVLGTSEGTSGSESDMSEGDRTTWLVISAILAVLGVVATVAAIVESTSYVEEHQRDIERAVAGGRGAFPSDLTAALGLPESEVPRVHKLLRDHREALLRELASLPEPGGVTVGGSTNVTRRTLGADQVRGFWTEVFRALEGDPVVTPRLADLKRRAARFVERATARSGAKSL